MGRNENLMVVVGVRDKQVIDREPTAADEVKRGRPRDGSGVGRSGRKKRAETLTASLRPSCNSRIRRQRWSSRRTTNTNPANQSSASTSLTIIVFRSINGPEKPPV
jgi:hypothetical protein